MYVEDYFRDWGDLRILFKKIPEIEPRKKEIPQDKTIKKLANFLNGRDNNLELVVDVDELI